MAWLGETGRRLWYFLNRSRLDRELREEMAAHRAAKGERGPRFGNELRLREQAADQWGWAWFDRLSQDVRFGARLLRRSPSFAITAITVLALGIGINLAAFQVFDAVALSWLPVRSPDTLFTLGRRSLHGYGTSFSYPEFEYYRSSASSLAAAFAFVYGSVDLEGVPATHAEFVTPTVFADLGARPVAGRVFDAADERRGADPVALLDEAVWRKRFGADPTIVGRAVHVNGHPFLVVGIASAFSGLGAHPAIWIPVTQHPAAFTGSTLLDDWSAKGAVSITARVRDGVSRDAARQELARLAAALQKQRPKEMTEGEWIDLRQAGTYLALDDANGVALALVTALVLLVLVTACMNLGVLVLARTLGRDREFGLRLSVGATRGRILRQLLTEHLVLGLLGAAAGCLVAAWAARGFAVATDLPAGISPHLSWRSSLVAVALALVSTLAFGFTPAMQAIRPSASRRLRLRSILVAVQVAAAAVLLIVSALLVRGVTRVTRVALGFDYQHTMVVDPDLAAHGMKARAAMDYWRRLEARMRQVPGVANVTVTTLPPFGNRVAIDGERTMYYGVTPSYFTTLRIPLLRGRLFRDGETGVTVVGEALARRKWPGEDPLGQKFGDAVVIGVVGSARTVRIGEEASSECYHPIAGDEMPMAVMVVRTAGPPQDAAPTVASIARAEGSGLTPSVVALADALQDKLNEPRQAALVVSALGITALLLAVVGLGGLVAFTVSQRTREIGVRVALGARPAHVVAAIARQFRMPVLCGALGGSVLAAGAGTILSSELFGVSQFDPLSHGGSLLLFAIVAVIGSAPAVRRALRVDPVTTLRAE